MTAKLRLRRSDGRLYLARSGFDLKPFGVYLHHITAPDPGPDLHDHPWPFVSIVLKGWYVEERCNTNIAVVVADTAVRNGFLWRGIKTIMRRSFSIKTLRLHEAHMITECHPDTWTLVIRGPKRSRRPGGEYWGFYTPKGYVPEDAYERLGARDLWNEVG